MPAPDLRAELSSLSTVLDELTRRLVALADASAEDQLSVAGELYEVERDLTAAARRLAKVVDAQ